MGTTAGSCRFTVGEGLSAMLCEVTYIRVTLYYYNELNGRFKAIEEKNIYTISNTYSDEQELFF